MSMGFGSNLSDHPYNSLEPQNHLLCNPCASISLKFFREKGSAVSLYDSFDELKVSAENGCPLCVIWKARLDSCFGLPVSAYDAMDYVLDAAGTIRVEWNPRGNGDSYDEPGLYVFRGRDSLRLPWKGVEVDWLPYRGMFDFTCEMKGLPFELETK
jgi:hypothetical protein